MAGTWPVRRAVIFVGIGLLLATNVRGDDPRARKIMGGIVEAMQVLLPLSLAQDRFLDPTNRGAILGALEELSEHAEKLERLGATRDAGFAKLSESLASDAESIRRRFVDGHPTQARFLLGHITETCVACHSRLPDTRPHPLGERLLNDPVIAALPASERVTLEVATRQFERALTSYEAIFADPASDIDSADLEGTFEGYLELSLRVNQDPQRAITHLQAVAARPDLPERMRSDLQSWIDSLESLRHPEPGPPIDRARALMGPTIDPQPMSERAALVRLVAASGILHRFIASGSASSAKLAEAYYLLGVIESQIGRSFWASQLEHFLEASIQSDPAGPYAEDAFALLDEFVTLGFTGSAGVNIPVDVAEHMNELQELIDRAQQQNAEPSRPVQQ